MRANPASAAVLACALAILTASPSSAQAESVRALTVDTSGQSLATALTDIARRSGRELLLSAPRLAERVAPRLRGRYTIEQALPLMLAGSGLTYRRTPDGGYLVYVAPALAPPNPEPETPVALPELLVTARSQNSDIQRTENDIQPYKVWSSRDIEQAHSADIDDFLRTRATGNAQPVSGVAQAVGLERRLSQCLALLLSQGRDHHPNLP